MNTISSKKFDKTSCQTSDFKKAIEGWVINHLSHPQPLLQNLSLCPYARTAFLQKKVGLLLAPEDLFASVDLHLPQFFQSNKDILVIGQKFSDKPIPLDEMREFVRKRRESYSQQDLWLLFDHPYNIEPFTEFKVNQGDYLLIFIQRLSALVLASRQLRDAGYYNQWPAEYLQKVVEEREIFYARYLERTSCPATSSQKHVANR